MPSMPIHGDPAAGTIAFGDILAGLSRALDITEGHPKGHSARSCLIGMRLASMLGLDERARSDLFYALLLKDAGCSSNAARVHQLFGGNEHEAKRAVWMRDWRNVVEQAAYALTYAGRGGTWFDRVRHLGRLGLAGPKARTQLFEIRCDRGANIALGLGLTSDTAAAIRTMDEHWDGGGQPGGLRGGEIPLLGRIIGVAQVAEIFWHEHGAAAALAVVRRRQHRWFDPELVRAFAGLAEDAAFWEALRGDDLASLIVAAEPAAFAIVADEGRLDQIAEAFASVVDAKSPFTSDHSRRVARFAVEIAERLGFRPAAVVRMRRAALLHDIGKLGVPNSILDKPDKLTEDEWRVMRQHTAHSFQILNAVPYFQEFAFDAACHHEKLNGKGYHWGLTAERLSPTARTLAVADIADALLADRPYRRGLDPDETMRILREECQRGAICQHSVAAATPVIYDAALSVPEYGGRAAAEPAAVGSIAKAASF
jgi:putative nucleotidyltransferase with HDIG domain